MTRFMNQNPYRLGLIKRSRRKYSLHLRKFGKHAGHNMVLRRIGKLSCLLILVSFLVRKHLKTHTNLHVKSVAALILCGITLLIKKKQLNVANLGSPPSIPRITITVDSFSEAGMDSATGFSKDEVVEMQRCMSVPEFFQINHGKHSFKVDGEHCFLYWLYRMHSPTERQSLDTEFWGFDYSTLSKIFNAVVKWMDNTHGHKLCRLPDIVNRLPEFNAKIIAKFRQENANAGLVAEPPELAQCSLFGDGTRFKVAKPEGADWKQRAAFSGDKWIHCAGALGIVGPDGIIYHWFDQPVGRHQDQYFLINSGVNEILRDMQIGQNIQYWQYMDKGFFGNTHTKCAYRGLIPLTPLQIAHNTAMAKVRICVEWCFGKLKLRNPILYHWRLLQMQSIDVARLIRVAALLTNAHTCLQQSTTGKYFDCFAPTLSQYFE